ncbi:MAG: hypothetical protein AB1894_08455 [Chloroflexota bacterium]
MKQTILLLAFLALGLAACLPLATPLPPLPTATPPAPTASATATIVWFPPTATPTPLPSVTLSITPTLDLSPRYGALLLADDFGETSEWSAGRSPAGSMTFGQGELTLAVSQGRGYLSSLRHGTSLGDFYLEINASPGICRAADEYGLLLRVASVQDFFRFALLCNGQARLDRILGGQASSPVPPKPNAAVPPGAPSTSRLAVWASGKEMRFYANGQYLFSVRDGTLLSGGLGVFARAAGDGAVTINFSDLAVYQIAP